MDTESLSYSYFAPHPRRLVTPSLTLMKHILLLLLTSSHFYTVSSYGSGYAGYGCPPNNGNPSSGYPGHGVLASGTSTFTIAITDPLSGSVVTSYDPSVVTPYTVTLSGGGTTFKGFVFSSFAGSAPATFTAAKYGTLTTTASGVQAMGTSCANGFTHIASTAKSSLVFRWQPPASATGNVTFWAWFVTGSYSATTTYNLKKVLPVLVIPSATPSASASTSPQPPTTPPSSVTPSSSISTSLTSTVTLSSSPTASFSATSTATSTSSPTLPLASNSPTRTVSSSVTATSTLTATPSATSTVTPTLTSSSTPTPTLSPTVTASATGTSGASISSSTTGTITGTMTASLSVGSTPSVTGSAALTVTTTPTQTSTPSGTSTNTGTSTATKTASATATNSPTLTTSATMSALPSPTSTYTSTGSITASAGVSSSTSDSTPTVTTSSTSTSTTTGTASRSSNGGSSTSTTPSSGNGANTSTPTSTPSSTATVSSSSSASASTTASSSSASAGNTGDPDWPHIVPLRTFDSAPIAAWLYWRVNTTINTVAFKLQSVSGAGNAWMGFAVSPSGTMVYSPDDTGSGPAVLGYVNPTSTVANSRDGIVTQQLLTSQVLSGLLPTTNSLFSSSFTVAPDGTNATLTFERSLSAPTGALGEKSINPYQSQTFIWAVGTSPSLGAHTPTGRGSITLQLVPVACSRTATCSAHGECVAGSSRGSASRFLCECDVGYTGSQCDACADGFTPSVSSDNGGNISCVFNSLSSSAYVGLLSFQICPPSTLALPNAISSIVRDIATVANVSAARLQVLAATTDTGVVSIAVVSPAPLLSAVFSPSSSWHVGSVSQRIQSAFRRLVLQANDYAVGSRTSTNMSLPLNSLLWRLAVVSAGTGSDASQSGSDSNCSSLTSTYFDLSDASSGDSPVPTSAGLFRITLFPSIASAYAIAVPANIGANANALNTTVTTISFPLPYEAKLNSMLTLRWAADSSYWYGRLEFSGPDTAWFALAIGVGEGAASTMAGADAIVAEAGLVSLTNANGGTTQQLTTHQAVNQFVLGTYSAGSMIARADSNLLSSSYQRFTTPPSSNSGDATNLTVLTFVRPLSRGSYIGSLALPVPGASSPYRQILFAWGRSATMAAGPHTHNDAGYGTINLHTGVYVPTTQDTPLLRGLHGLFGVIATSILVASLAAAYYTVPTASLNNDSPSVTPQASLSKKSSVPILMSSPLHTNKQLPQQQQLSQPQIDTNSVEHVALTHTSEQLYVLLHGSVPATFLSLATLSSGIALHTDALDGAHFSTLHGGIGIVTCISSLLATLMQWYAQRTTMQQLYIRLDRTVEATTLARTSARSALAVTWITTVLHVLACILGITKMADKAGPTVTAGAAIGLILALLLAIVIGTGWLRKYVCCAAAAHNSTKEGTYMCCCVPIRSRTSLLSTSAKGRLVKPAAVAVDDGTLDSTPNAPSVPPHAQHERHLWRGTSYVIVPTLPLTIPSIAAGSSSRGSRTEEGSPDDERFSEFQYENTDSGSPGSGNSSGTQNKSKKETNSRRRARLSWRKDDIVRSDEPTTTAAASFVGPRTVSYNASSLSPTFAPRPLQHGAPHSGSQASMTSNEAGSKPGSSGSSPWTYSPQPLQAVNQKNSRTAPIVAVSNAASTSTLE